MSTSDIGAKTTCMELVSTFGLTVASTKVTFKMTRNMDLASTLGRMVGDTMVTGSATDNTAWEPIWCQKTAN